MIETLYPFALLAMTLTVGAAVPILFMLRVFIGQRHRGLGLGIILLDALITIKALVVAVGVVLTWNVIAYDDGRVRRELLTVVLILLALQAWVTLVRIVYWWLDMRRRNVEGFT